MLAEDPGVAERRPADGDRGAAGVLEHPPGVGGRGDVAAGDDRHVDGGHDLGGDAVVGGAAVLLGRRARVHAERGRAGLLEAQGGLDRARAWSGVSPRRIFTVTGMSTARTIASTMAAAATGSASSAAPAPVLQILGTGQPMFTSIRSAPAGSTARAASAMASASAPKTWTPTGCSSGTIVSIPSVLRLA